MSVVGLITEYNPFHNGHLYHIEEAKRLTGADHVVVVMSGNFVQRGMPAIIDKYRRTKMGLLYGVDLVVELPVCYATASAEIFALGAVSILDKLGFIDSIVFGSECGDLPLLEEIAHVLTANPEELMEKIKLYIKEGISYPAARAKALCEYMIAHTSSGKLDDQALNTKLQQVLTSPNNILGIEYLKALLSLDSSIKPYTIKRVGSNYHEEMVTGTISSATAIRNAIMSKDTPFVSASMNPINSLLCAEFKTSLPTKVYEMLQQEYKKSYPYQSTFFETCLKYRLMSLTFEELIQYSDVTDNLANRIKSLKISTLNYSELITAIKSKQYTQTRIQRILLHILLHIKKEDMIAYKDIGYTPYAKILGFRKSSSILLREVMENDKFQLITKLSNANLSPLGSRMLETDQFANNLYHTLIYESYGTKLKDDYTHGLVIIDC